MTMVKTGFYLKTILRIIGAAAVSANLLWELSIAEKKDDNETNIKKGIVILVRFIAKFIFKLSSINPGAIRETNAGINICKIKTITNRIKNKRLNISLANLFDFFFPLINSDD